MPLVNGIYESLLTVPFTGLKMDRKASRPAVLPGARSDQCCLSCSFYLVASQGFEPRLIGSEPTVLPLNEEATDWCGAADLLAFRLQITADVRLS